MYKLQLLAGSSNILSLCTAPQRSAHFLIRNSMLAT